MLFMLYVEAAVFEFPNGFTDVKNVPTLDGDFVVLASALAVNEFTSGANGVNHDNILAPVPTALDTPLLTPAASSAPTVAEYTGLLGFDGFTVFAAAFAAAAVDE